MKKRAFASVLLAFLVLTCVLPPGRAAPPAAQFLVHVPEALPQVGEEFTATVSLADNPGFCAIQFTLSFDPEVLECTQASFGKELDGAMMVSNPEGKKGATVAAISLEPIQVNGEIAEFTFRVKKAGAAPDFQLLMTSFCQADGVPLPYTVILPGDEEAPQKPSPGTEESHGPTTPGDSEEGNSPAEGDDPPVSTAPSETNTPTPDAQPGALETAPSFVDAAGHWGEDYIARAVAKGLFKGYPDSTFRPDEEMSRAQFITVLWRTAGCPMEDGPVPFTDTQDQIQEFQDAISWGYRQGIIQGTSSTTFSPEKSLTRQEAMTILHRFSGGERGMEIMLTGIYDDAFQDYGEIADWAKPAMYWGVFQELIQGTGPKTLSPTGVATRAQIAKIMVEYEERVGKEM